MFGFPLCQKQKIIFLEFTCVCVLVASSELFCHGEIHLVVYEIQIKDSEIEISRLKIVGSEGSVNSYGRGLNLVYDLSEQCGPRSVSVTPWLEA